MNIRKALFIQFLPQLGRFFAGASMVFYYTKIGDEKHLSVQNQKWHLRTFFGIRL
ncbi:MAG: hypothetical protein K5764_03690 [Prevotella sp.]|nr:hypothetical protein [Prevotella sp.]